jgi:RNA polymerase sigma-70 factor (ECF subfamily)
MDLDSSFSDLMQRVRAGDGQAAAELVRLYEPEIRAEVRALLRDRRLRRAFDSLDVCQSVLGSFFARAAEGRYQLQRPEHLLRLLLRMTRNKLATQVRRQRSQRRNYRRQAASVSVEHLEVAARDGDPSQIVAGRELLVEFRRRLSAEERELADLRAAGAAWDAVVVKLGGTSEGRRKQLGRAVERVSLQLGLEVDR